VALVASNFPQAERPKAYGLVAASGAIAVAAGPLIGGLLTTYASWRWVFAGEVIIVVAILMRTKRMAAEPPDPSVGLDPIGTLLSATGLGLVVFAILRAGTWGFVQPKPGGPEWAGVSPVVWLVLAGLVVLWGFLAWEGHRIRQDRSALFDPKMLDVPLLRSGLSSFSFQYLLQSGLFFTVPLYLSVSLGLTAVATGVRLLPLSVALLITAVGIPRFFPNASPRRVVQLGFLGLLAGIASLAGAIEIGSGPDVVGLPMLLAGLGIGALASQLGAVTVSAVPDEQSAEVGGLQNTVTNLGASIGTALAGAVLISALTSSFFTGLATNPDVPDDVTSAAEVRLAAGVPFVSDADLEAALADSGLDDETASAIAEENAQARVDGLQSALVLLALVAVLALFSTRGIPRAQPAASAATGP
jgi:multisubunit Na+/H+ antiporter MnhC subunit